MRPNNRLCALAQNLRCADTRTLSGPLGWKHDVATCAWKRAQIRRNSGRLTNYCPLQTQITGSHLSRHSPLKGASGKTDLYFFSPFTSFIIPPSLLTLVFLAPPLTITLHSHPFSPSLAPYRTLPSFHFHFPSLASPQLFHGMPVSSCNTLHSK